MHPVEQRELFLELFQPQLSGGIAPPVEHPQQGAEGRQGDSDEPNAPLLLEWELAVGEGDVVIGGEGRDQADITANDGFQQGFAVEPQPPPGQRCIQIPRISIDPKQPARPNSDSNQLSTCV